VSAGAVLLPAVLTGLAVVAWLGMPRGAALRVDAVLGGRSPGSVPRRCWVHVGPLTARAHALRERLGRRGLVEQERSRSVEACAVLSGELRAGRPPAPALEAAASVACGPTATALRAAASAAALGGDVPATLTGASADSAVPELLRGLAACWAVCAATGSGLAAAVERLGEAERAAAEQRRAVEVELAGPRASARMLALLPLVGLLMAAGLGAAPLAFLIGSFPGRVCLVLGVGLEVVGLRWTGRLAARAGRSG
jgi:tight adherence protein B